jgi:tetratricopeptide (TPR) repeat protein
MKIHRHKILITVLLVLLFSFGCTVAPRPKSSGRTRAELDTPPSESPYYHYTRSQLFLREGEINRAVESLQTAIQKDTESLFLRIELTQIYIGQRRYNDAITVAESMLEKDSDDVRVLTLIAGLHETLGEYEAAIDTYKEIISGNPDNENGYLLMGSVYVQKGEPENAIKVLKKAIELNGESIKGHYLIGKAYMEFKEYAKAIFHLLKTLELNPRFEPALFDLVSIYQDRDDRDMVLETYQQILKNNPDNLRAAVGLNRYYLISGDAGKARKGFSELIDRTNNASHVVKQIALIYLDQNKYAEAIQFLEILIKEEPQDSEILYFLGLACSGKEENGKAINYYQMIPAESNYFVNAVVQIAYLYQKEQETDKAIATLLSATEAKPDQPEFFLYLGSLYEEKEDYTKAVASLNKGLSIAPENTNLHFRLGVVYDMMDKKDLSIKEMKQVIQLDPKHATALNYLGYTYADIGTNLDEAEELVKTALELKPGDGYFMDSLGWVYFKKGFFDKATIWLKKAAELVPEDPIILEHLADAYIEAGIPETAMKYYRLALEKKVEQDATQLKEKIEALKEKMLPH